MSRRSAHRCALAAMTLAGTLLAGCASSGEPQQPPSASSTPSAPSAPSTPLTSAAPSSAPVSSTPESTTAAPTTESGSSSTAAESTPAGSSPSPSGPHTTCSRLSVRVIPGGASFGEQIAGLQFTNEGSTKCVLVGYPTVTLLLDGRVIGQPSRPSTDEPSLRRLRPGEVAESLLHDYTQTCQAPLSDSVRVQVPGSTQTVIRPDMQLRACVLRVDKLGPPD